MAYLSLDCYWFTSFKNFAKNKKKIRDGYEVQFFCLLFCVGSFSQQSDLNSLLSQR